MTFITFPSSRAKQIFRAQFFCFFLTSLLTLSVSFVVRFGSADQVLLFCQGARDGCIKDVCFQEPSVGGCVCGCWGGNLVIRQNKARKTWL